jgi:probable F420-dependent oxidoreductase
MRFGVALPSFGHAVTREAVLAVARTAERLGYATLWAGDHVAFPLQSASAYPYSDTAMVATGHPAAGDPLVSLAVAAGATETIVLGTSVLILPYRNPLVTAKMVATLDVLSGGRTVLGVGAGWLREEFEALGAPPFKARGAVTDEWIAILRRCWTDPEPEFHGDHYSFAPVDFQPRPTRHVPILVGGNSAPALRRAGTLADGWIGTSVTIEEAGKAVRTVCEHAERAGRDPAALSFGSGCSLDITDVEHDDPRHLRGTRDQLAERVAELEAAGLDHLELRLAVLRDPRRASVAAALETLEAFMT